MVNCRQGEEKLAYNSLIDELDKNENTKRNQKRYRIYVRNNQESDPISQEKDQGNQETKYLNWLKQRVSGVEDELINRLYEKRKSLWKLYRDKEKRYRLQG